MTVTTLPPCTIGIPFFNAEATLLDAVRSVFAQTHQNWELFLVDDGSTDRSLELAKSINDPRVTVVSDGCNRRLAARLNQIVRLAKFDYIARMDADDLMVPTRIERLLSILVMNPEYELASSGVFSVNAGLGLNGIRGELVENYDFSGLVRGKQRFVHAGLVAKKSWFERNRYDETIPCAEDSELWLRTALSGDFPALSIPDPLYIYREEGNVTKSKLLAAYDVERTRFSRMIESPSHRLLYAGRALAKSAVTRILHRMGAMPMLLRRRQSGVITGDILQRYELALQQVRETRLPLSAA